MLALHFVFFEDTRMWTITWCVGFLLFPGFSSSGKVTCDQCWTSCCTLSHRKRNNNNKQSNSRTKQDFFCRSSQAEFHTWFTFRCQPPAPYPPHPPTHPFPVWYILKNIMTMPRWTVASFFAYGFADRPAATTPSPRTNEASRETHQEGTCSASTRAKFSRQGRNMQRLCWAHEQWLARSALSVCKERL